MVKTHNLIINCSISRRYCTVHDRPILSVIYIIFLYTKSNRGDFTKIFLKIFLCLRFQIEWTVAFILKIRETGAYKFLALSRYKIYTNARRRIIPEKSLPKRSLQILFFHLRLCVPSDLFSSRFPTIGIYLLRHMFHMLHPTHRPSFAHSNNILSSCPHKRPKVSRGSDGIDPLILNLHIKWW